MKYKKIKTNITPNIKAVILDLLNLSLFSFKIIGKDAKINPIKKKLVGSGNFKYSISITLANKSIPIPTPKNNGNKNFEYSIFFDFGAKIKLPIASVNLS